jgi:hypothetical protein
VLPLFDGCFSVTQGVSFVYIYFAATDAQAVPTSDSRCKNGDRYMSMIWIKKIQKFVQIKFFFLSSLSYL